MRPYAHVSFGLILGAAFLLAGCAGEQTPPPVHNKNLGTAQGEVLVPYEPPVSHKLLKDPNTFQVQAPPTPEPATPAEVEADAYATLARQIVDDLSKAGYEQVVARFDETLAAQMSAPQLQMTWETIITQAGPFQEIMGVRREQTDGMEVAVVTVRFERTSGGLLVAFNANQQVSGLRPVPAEGAAGETPAEAPAASPAEAPTESPAEPPAEGAAPAGDSAAPAGGSTGGMSELPPTAPAPVGGL